MIFYKLQNRYHKYQSSVYDVHNQKVLYDFIDYYLDNDIHVYLHSIPTNKLDLFFNPQLIEQYSILLDSLKSNKNVTTISYPNAFPSDWFADIDHMNDKGAIIYTKFLLGKIAY